VLLDLLEMTAAQMNVLHFLQLINHRQLLQASWITPASVSLLVILKAEALKSIVNVWQMFLKRATKFPQRQHCLPCIQLRQWQDVPQLIKQ
jgi:hypothetical protein